MSDVSILRAYVRNDASFDLLNPLSQLDYPMRRHKILPVADGGRNDIEVDI